MLHCQDVVVNPNKSAFSFIMSRRADRCTTGHADHMFFLPLQKRKSKPIYLLRRHSQNCELLFQLRVCLFDKKTLTIGNLEEYSSSDDDTPAVAKRLASAAQEEVHHPSLRCKYNLQREEFRDENHQQRHHKQDVSANKNQANRET